MTAFENRAGPVGGRIDEIDGIRGWASLVVLAYHAFGEMLKVRVTWLDGPAASTVLAADLGVAVFFVLSGDALSRGFFGSGNPAAIDRLVVRRYARLTIPIAMSCLISWGLMRAGLDRHREAAVLLSRQDWLGEFLPFAPSLFECLKYALINVYTAHSRGNSYNPFLWTMSVEMVGSLLVFLTCYLWPRLRRPEWICAGAALTLWMLGSFYALFFAGMLLGRARATGWIDRLRANREHQRRTAFLVVGVLAGHVIVRYLAPDAGLAHRLALPPLAVALVFCGYTNSALRAFFASGVSRFLGEISFPIYLVQFPVLISLMSWLTVRVAAAGALSSPHLIAVAAVGTTATVVAAVPFRAVERRVLALIDPWLLRSLS